MFFIPFFFSNITKIYLSSDFFTVDALFYECYNENKEEKERDSMKQIPAVAIIALLVLGLVLIIRKFGRR